MRFGVLGTGAVGAAIGTKLASLGHEVTMGSRTADNEKAVAWAASMGPSAHHGTFADAAAAAEIVVNCTAGAGSLEALAAAGAEHLDGKVLIDVSNALDHSTGAFPPPLFVCNTDSLGEQIQRAFPAAKVVKTLNTMNRDIMVNPARVPGDHVVFVSGNDDGAKAQVRELLGSFGWPAGRIVDLGDITTARGTEAYLLLWLSMMIARGNGAFNIAVTG
jgi:8-hydroxy-5-deazaflavin:NADPH oxidoreductase